MRFSIAVSISQAKVPDEEAARLEKKEAEVARAAKEAEEGEVTSYATDKHRVVQSEDLKDWSFGRWKIKS